MFNSEPEVGRLEIPQRSEFPCAEPIGDRVGIAGVPQQPLLAVLDQNTLTECFTDGRAAELIEHEVRTLVGQRVFGIALGYEDVVDHDELRHDPTMAALAGKLSARPKDCAPLAGKSTLNRLELGGVEPTRYHRIA
jgi:hypothetical protein